MEDAPEQLYECNWKRGCDCNWARLIHIVYVGLVSSPATEALCKLEEVTGKEVGDAMSTLQLCQRGAGRPAMRLDVLSRSAQPKLAP